MCTDAHHDTAPPPAPVRVAEWKGEVVDLEPVDSVTVTTVCDNYIDVFLADQGPARRLFRPASGRPRRALPATTLVEGEVVDSPVAQHGFAAHVTVTRNGRSHRLLFDTGITPEGCVDNMDRLDLDPGDLEAVVCSHGHFDHATGLSGLSRRLRGSMPVVIHPDFWSQRRISVPGADPVELPTTSQRALEDAGFAVVEGRQPSFLFDRSVLVTGEVDRTSAFETGFPFHEAHRHGAWEPDPLILDDQALVVNVSGKGLVVLTGCGHAGITNICDYARRLTGVDRLYAVIGGFHLTGPLFEARIGATCDALSALAPEVVVPAHCTGWRAVHAIAARMPESFIQNSVGTAFDLVSAAG